MAKDQKDQDLAPVKQSVPLRELFDLTLKNWKWVLLSLVLCLGLATLYILAKTPTFKREASVVIKGDEDAMGGLGAGMADLGIGNIGLFGGNSNFENEITTFRSPDYMEEVVKILGLETSYYMKKGLRNVPLYGSSLPLTVDFLDLPESESATIKFTVLKNGEIRVSRKMIINSRTVKMEKDLITHFDTTIDTPAGPIVIRKTSNWGVKPRQMRGIEPEEDDDDELRFRVSRMSMLGAIEAYQAETDISRENDKGATIINLEVVDASKQRGDDILNTLINVYKARTRDDKNEVAVNTSKFIDERLAVISEELGSVDQSITNYKKENGIIDLPASSRVTLEKTAEADKKYFEERNNLEIAIYLRDFLQREGNKYQTLPVNMGIGSATLEKQFSDYNEMMLQRNKLDANSGKGNPLVGTLDHNLSSMRVSLISALDNQVKILQNSLSSIKSEQAQNSSVIHSNPDQVNYLRTQGREQTVKEQLYLYLLQKKEENEMSRAFNDSNLKIIKKPTGPVAPYKPKKGLIFAFAVILGLGFPIGVIYMREVSNTKLRGRKDVENLDIPVLGEVPQLRKKMMKEAEDGSNVVVAEGQRDVANEAFRVVRTNLSLMTSHDHNSSVIMVTSFIPNSGKTFVTLNLAAACAMKKKVVVVDCDFRKRSASYSVGVHNKGLTDYINGHTDSIDSLLVCDTIARNMCVLPSGTLPPNPTELLESPRFKQAIDELRNKFDYIFIDCPPSEMMADSQIVNQVADRTIYILRAGNLELSALPILKQYYIDKKYKNISIVLNGLKEVERGSYGSYESYGEVADEARGWRRWFGKKRK